MNNRTTTDGKPPAPGAERAGAPQPINPATGQHGAYYILSEEERAKGFIRPVRLSYVHVGIAPTYPLRELTPEETERFKPYGYVKFEAYPDGEAATGRYWTEAQLRGGCRAVTAMDRRIAETYARDPKFYGATFCVGCMKHLPVAEFRWLDSTDEVGS